MKKTSVLGAAVLAAVATFGGFAASTQAAVLYNENFTDTTNGNLIGQDGWNLTGTSNVNPIQVTSGVVGLVTTGQDANAALTAPVTAGNSAYASLLVNVTAAQATGDYFFHFANNVADSSLFTGRLFVKSSGAGYVLGFQFGSSGVTYSSTVVSLNAYHTIVLRYDIVSGATNDTAALYVDPTDLSVEGNNTPYLTAADATVSEPTQSFGTVNLRQGTAANAPTLLIDALTVANSFADAMNPGPTQVFTSVPEPASLGVLGLGISALLLRRRK